MAKRTSKAEEPTTTEVAKAATVVILPCQARLPQGHILIAAIHGDSLAGTKSYECRNEMELNAHLMDTIRVSTETGYSIEIIVAGRVHYKNTLRQFKRDPLSAVEFCREYSPRQQQQEDNGDDLPF